MFPTLVNRSLWRMPRCAALMAIGLTLVLPAVSAAQVVYPSPTLHPSQGGPRGLAAGDLNGDGELDLVATAYASGRILIHPGFGDGRFSVPRSIFVGGAPVAVATGDFDRDGLADAVYVDERAGEVGVLLQRSTFPVSYETQKVLGADEPRSLLLTDLDGDQWPDVVVAQRGADQIAVFANANGVLSSPTVQSVGDGPIRLGQLPQLGSDRLLVLHDGFLSNDLLTLDLLSGDLVGRAAFTGPRDLLITDHDGDGTEDVVVLDGDAGQVQVLSTSDGVLFDPVESFAVERGSLTLSLLDGAPGARRYLVGDSARASYAVYENFAGNIARQRSWLGGASLQDLVLADFDGDGAKELVVSLNDLDAVQISPPSGSGFVGFETVYTGLAPSQIAERPTGRTTYSVLCGGTSDVRSYDLVGNGLTALDVVPVHVDAIRQGWVDYDRDGLEDLVTLVARLGVQVHHNNGAGFDAPITTALDGELRDLLVFDAVGDSLPDLLVANSTLNGVVVLEGDGSTGFSPSDTLIFNQRPARVRSRDLDLDGREDLVVLSVETQVAISYRRDIGLSNPTVFSIGEEPRDASFGDFNGDIYPDIVIANAGGSSFSILNSVVQGIYSPTVVAQQTPSGAENVVVADVDLTGQDDILFSSPSSQYLTYHLNTGTPTNPTGRFTIPQRVRVAVVPLAIRTADLDGDPIDDVLVVDLAASVITLVRSDPTVLVAPAQARLSARREGDVIRLEVAGTPVTSAEFQLRRGSDGQRLVPRAVEAGRWVADDRVDSDASETYMLYDRAGLALDEVVLAAQPETRPAWSILPVGEIDGAVEVRFRGPTDAPASVDIVDLRGRRIARLAARLEGSGWQRVRWEGSDDRGRRVARGRYWAQLHVGGESRVVGLPPRLR